NEAMSRLTVGDFPRGFAKYEWRWRLEKFPSPKRNFAQPLWRGGETIAGKTILLHAEQGLGDAIQFCRYAQRVAQIGADVILQVRPPMRALMAGMGHEMGERRRGGTWRSFGPPAPRWGAPP